MSLPPARSGLGRFQPRPGRRPRHADPRDGDAGRRWRRCSSPPPASIDAAPGLGLRPRLRRGGAGRRHRRLVRGHRPVPPPARPPHPAHRDHPRNKDRIGDTLAAVPQATISSPPRWWRGGCATSTSPARSAASSPAAGRGAAARGRLAAARRHPRGARPGAARRHGQGGGRRADARDRRRASARPDARGGDHRGAARARWSTASSPGPAAPSTPTRI